MLHHAFRVFAANLWNAALACFSGASARTCVERFVAWRSSTAACVFAGVCTDLGLPNADSVRLRLGRLGKVWSWRLFLAVVLGGCSWRCLPSDKRDRGAAVRLRACLLGCAQTSDSRTLIPSGFVWADLEKAGLGGCSWRCLPSDKRDREGAVRLRACLLGCAQTSDSRTADSVRLGGLGEGWSWRLFLAVSA